MTSPRRARAGTVWAWAVVLLAAACCSHAAPASGPIVIPPASPRIVTYNRIWYALYFVGTAWGFLGLLAFLRWRVGARLRDWAEGRARNRLFRVALFYLPFSLLLVLWGLPLDALGYVIERAYHFATQSPVGWLGDQGKGYLLGLIQIPAVWLGYLLLERSPRRWWLWLWLLSIPWSLAMTVVYPVVFDPLYNDFRPLRDRHLEQRLVALADRAGVHGARVYEVDKSRRTTKLNAYVTGLGPTKRIVIWDTTLKALPEDQVVAIVGHEMGHYVLRHVWWNFVGNVFGAFVFLRLMAWLLPWAVARWGPRAGIRAVHDIAGLPLALLLLGAMGFLQTPIESAISRYEEHQADRYGLELTGLNDAMARAFVTFVTRDYADPDPPRFIVWWFYSHPPIRDRAEFALTYHGGR